ncbi:hypothetical protein [Aphanizomenon flos-aquae]|nr:hypothetical protein [Aphanizomenon flos-aquae]
MNLMDGIFLTLLNAAICLVLPSCYLWLYRLKTKSPKSQYHL